MRIKAGFSWIGLLLAAVLIGGIIVIVYRYRAPLRDTDTTTGSTSVPQVVISPNPTPTPTPTLSNSIANITPSPKHGDSLPTSGPAEELVGVLLGSGVIYSGGRYLSLKKKLRQSWENLDRN